MTRAYYNEIDPFAAQWLKNLIDADAIAPGDVDTRSIEDVTPNDLAGYTQCHFFAGIGVWSYALRRAGWPDDRPVWTGSCPCQPFSAAGKGRGVDDERHLWPAWFHLIELCRPDEIFGEQVASKDADPWIDLVQADLEAVGYALGAVPFPAAGVGAPNIRDRLYWVAESGSQRCVEQRLRLRERRQNESLLEVGRRGEVSRLGNPGGGGSGRHTGAILGTQSCAERGVRSVTHISEPASTDRRRADTDGTRHIPRTLAGVHSGEEVARSRNGELERQSAACGLADDESNGRREERTNRRGEPAGDSAQGRAAGLEPSGMPSDVPGPVNGFWRAADWLLCRDPDVPRWRPVEPGTFPLAHGASARVGRLRGYGNAINAEAAKAFIESYLEATL